MTDLVSPCVGVPHSPEAMPFVHEEMPLVVSLSQVHGSSEPPLHVVLPFAFVPVWIKNQQ